VRILWSPLARDQAGQALLWLAAERPQTAKEWIEELVSRVSALGAFPDMGRMVPEAQRPSLREVLVPPYRIIYRRDETQVVILAVHHVRRDFVPGRMEP
jgi:toxin ParE1/3/4